jgi:7-carboxy-7-deazaguanine synthase
VELTGGEPLEQDDAYPLMDRLLERNYTVMLETGGHLNIGRVPEPVIKIIDIKCPDSREGGSFCWDNIGLARPHDEFKFVLASRRDYEWSREVVRGKLAGKPNTVLFSPVHGDLDLQELARWILDDGLPVRLQIQLHKYIWGAGARGV